MVFAAELDAKFLHAVAQGIGIDSQEGSRLALTGDLAACRA